VEKICCAVWRTIFVVPDGLRHMSFLLPQMTVLRGWPSPSARALAQRVASRVRFLGACSPGQIFRCLQSGADFYPTISVFAWQQDFCYILSFALCRRLRSRLLVFGQGCLVGGVPDIILTLKLMYIYVYTYLAEYRFLRVRRIAKSNC
jgi:hypothetical protein